MEQDVILQVENLKKYFMVENRRMLGKKSYVKAVDDVSFQLERGQALGLVGESGCGKTTLVNVLMGLEPATGGSVMFDGRDLFTLSAKDQRSVKKDIQIVFQDPFWSLNPRMLVKDIIAEPLGVHTQLRGAELEARITELLGMVGLAASEAYMYPHEFSSGQRQRIAIARALALSPKLVVLDEPTSSIDLASQVQILQLLTQLKQQLNLTYILISHDLSVVNKMSNIIAVMYLGKLVEYGDSKLIFNDPRHPYTKALFGSILRPELRSLDDLEVLEGAVPSAIDPPSGCRFHTRCRLAQPICSQEEPPLTEFQGRLCACHFCQNDKDQTQD